VSLHTPCKRCLAEPSDLYSMLPMSYSTMLCVVCRNEWEQRKPEILRAALDLFVSETPEPQVPSSNAVVRQHHPQKES